MHFTLSRKVFSTYLSIASKAVAYKSPLPALSGIKIEVKDNKINLISSNEEMSIKTQLDESINNLNMTIIKEGSILIDSDYINKIVSTIDSDLIEFELMEGYLIKVSGLKSEFKINGMKDTDFPAIEFNDGNKVFYLNSKTLDEIIEDTAFAASEERTRPSLTGINFKCTNSVLKCVATDSYRLAQKNIELLDCEDFNVTIPANNLKKFFGIARVNEQIKISISNKFIQFNIDNSLIKINLIDDQFPDTDRLIPTEFINVLEINAQELLKIIDRASFIANNKMSIIKLNANNDEVVVSSQSQEIGSYNDSLNINKFEGNPLEISFSGTYLKEALKIFGNGDCKISFSGTLKPFIITSEKNEEVLQLLVPVRTYM